MTEHEADPATAPKVDTAPQATARRFLMCSPEHFAITFEINPWMGLDDQPDPAQSMREWENLISCLRAAGATVLPFPMVPGLSDMVFPADIAVASGDSFAQARFRYAERRPEAELGRQRLEGLGLRAMTWWDNDADGCLDAADGRLDDAGMGLDEDDVCIDGGAGRLGGGDVWLEGGDVLAFGRTLVAGHGPRTALAAHRALARCFGADVVTVAVADPRFYHLDMSFCPLDARRAIVAADAWNRASIAGMRELVPEPLLIDIHEAATFCANSVVVGRTVFMPACPPRIGRQLERWGFDVCVCPVGEFLKAGGGIRCMTLDLDLLGPR